MRVHERLVAAYAASLPLGAPSERRHESQRTGTAPDTAAGAVEEEGAAALWLTLDAINFGSGWFPTLRKREGSSGYQTIAAALQERFGSNGPWRAAELRQLSAADLASALGQDPDHELMALFARSLNDLGAHVAGEFNGSFAGVVDAAAGSARRLVQALASWDCFADTSTYEELTLPFLKRAQIAAADLHRAGIVEFGDIGELTMFADNLVPHVLRLDGLLQFRPELVARIECGELIDHGSAEEVEIRACAVHAVELIVGHRPQATAMQVDEVLWQRGQQPHYKDSPRHRSRCTAY